MMELTIDHREPIVVGVCIFQCVKVRRLELYYYPFVKLCGLCGVSKIEELDMDTDLHY